MSTEIDFIHVQIDNLNFQNNFRHLLKINLLHVQYIFFRIANVLGKGVNDIISPPRTYILKNKVLQVCEGSNLVSICDRSSVIKNILEWPY